MTYQIDIVTPMGCWFHSAEYIVAADTGTEGAGRIDIVCRVDCNCHCTVGPAAGSYPRPFEALGVGSERNSDKSYAE
jgi:hypothetical protein